MRGLLHASEWRDPLVSDPALSSSLTSRVSTPTHKIIISLLLCSLYTGPSLWEFIIYVPVKCRQKVVPKQEK